MNGQILLETKIGRCSQPFALVLYHENDYCRLNVCVLPAHSQVEILTSDRMVLGGGPLRSDQFMRGEPSQTGLVPLQKRLQRAPSPSVHSRKLAIYEPGSGLSWDTRSASAIISDFPPYKTMRNQCLVTEAPCLWDSVSVAQTVTLQLRFSTQVLFSCSATAFQATPWRFRDGCGYGQQDVKT